VSAHVAGYAGFLLGALLMALFALWSDGRASAWLAERRLDVRVWRIARRRDLDAAYRLIVEEEQAGWAAEPIEPWDSSGWLEDVPREGDAR